MTIFDDAKKLIRDIVGQEFQWMDSPDAHKKLARRTRRWTHGSNQEAARLSHEIRGGELDGDHSEEMCAVGAGAGIGSDSDYFSSIPKTGEYAIEAPEPHFYQNYRFPDGMPLASRKAAYDIVDLAIRRFCENVDSIANNHGNALSEYDKIRMEYLPCIYRSGGDDKLSLQNPVEVVVAGNYDDYQKRLRLLEKDINTIQRAVTTGWRRVELDSGAIVYERSKKQTGGHVLEDTADGEFTNLSKVDSDPLGDRLEDLLRFDLPYKRNINRFQVSSHENVGPQNESVIRVSAQAAPVLLGEELGVDLRALDQKPIMRYARQVDTDAKARW